MTIIGSWVLLEITITAGSLVFSSQCEGERGNEHVGAGAVGRVAPLADNRR